MSNTPSRSSGEAATAISAVTQPIVQAITPHVAPLIAGHVVAPLAQAAILSAMGVSGPAGTTSATPGQNSGSRFAGSNPTASSTEGVGPLRNSRVKPDPRPYPARGPPAPRPNPFASAVLQPPINPYNPNGLDENCVFISMGYLLDPSAAVINARKIVDITEEMQPADGRGGVTPIVLSRMLDSVHQKLGIEYKLEKWDPRNGPLSWTSVLGSRYAILYERHLGDCEHQPGTYTGTEGQRGSTRCIVADNPDPQYRKQRGISGHCVVYDAKRPPYPPGFFDFQASGLPAPNLKEGDLWIEEHGAMAFGFPGHQSRT